MKQHGDTCITAAYAGEATLWLLTDQQPEELELRGTHCYGIVVVDRTVEYGIVEIAALEEMVEPDEAGMITSICPVYHDSLPCTLRELFYTTDVGLYLSQ